MAVLTTARDVFCLQERRRQAPGLAKLEKAVRERDAQISALKVRRC